MENWFAQPAFTYVKYTEDDDGKVEIVENRSIVNITPRKVKKWKAIDAKNAVQKWK